MLTFCVLCNQAREHYNFGPLSVCLSMNYWDRFLSVYPLPVSSELGPEFCIVCCFSITQCVFVHVVSVLDFAFPFCSPVQRDKTWAVQLLAVACLSLASKMEETDVPQTVDLQV